jgi:hypothetical protein
MLTGAVVGTRFLGRVCVLSFRTRRADVETCVQQLAEEAAALLAAAGSDLGNRGQSAVSRRSAL